MSDIGIIGAGTAGLHLALLLQQRGLEPTLYAERTADEVRGGRLPNTVAHNYRTRARERALGVNHWDGTAPAIEGHWHFFPGEQPLDFPGYFPNPSLSVDYRLYQAQLLEDFEERGGTAVAGALSTDDLPRLSERHDLLVVSTGRGGFGELFPPERQPFSGPQRVLSAGLYSGVARRSEHEYVTFSVTPGHGEIIEIPMQSFEGDVTVVLFECIPGGDLEVLSTMPYADDPKGYERTVVEKVRAYCPPISERLDDSDFALARPDSILQGAVTPTVRRSHAKLDNGRYAIAVGDAHVAMDPVVGLGANSASLGAWTLGEVILEGGPFDEQFCQKVDERRLPGVLAHFEFTNIMLAPPPPHVLEVIGAMSQNPALANDFTDNFTDPSRHLANLASPDAAAAYIASFSSQD